MPYCPSQNSVAERKDRALLEMARSILFKTNLIQKFCIETINTAIYLQNRLHTKSNHRTPYANFGKKNLFHLKEFGWKVYAYVNKRGKLDDKTEQGSFIGQDNRSRRYHIYTERKNVIIARTVKCKENTIPNSNTKAELKF